MTRTLAHLVRPLLLSSSLVLAALAAAPGCSSDGGGGGGGTSGTGGGGGSANPCTPTAAECYSDGQSGPGAECLARHDNTGKPKVQLRVSQMAVDSPTVLASPFMQDAIITKKVNFNQPTCNQNGNGQFNILLEFDPATNELTVGTAVPHALIGDGTGPKEDGACFTTATDPGSGIQIEPVTTVATVDGQKITATFDRLVLPVYLEDKDSNYVLLPLNKVVLSFTLSADSNCVGRYKTEVLQPETSCAPPLGEFAWENGGTLDAYITAVEAESVQVVSLGQTLCVVLSGDSAQWGGTPGYACDVNDPSKLCKGCAYADVNKDTSGQPKPAAELVYPDGDWCAGTNSAATATCKDAFHLVTGIAASAIQIKPTCD